MDRKIKAARVKRMRKYKEYVPGDWNFIKEISESTGEDIDIRIDSIKESKFLSTVIFSRKSEPEINARICFYPGSGRIVAMITDDEIIVRKIKDISSDIVSYFLENAVSLNKIIKGES